MRIPRRTEVRGGADSAPGRWEGSRGQRPASCVREAALRWVVGSPVPVTPAASNKRAAGLATDGVCARVGGLRWGG